MRFIFVRLSAPISASRALHDSILLFAHMLLRYTLTHLSSERFVSLQCKRISSVAVRFYFLLLTQVKGLFGLTDFFSFFFSYRDSHLMIGIPLSRVLCRIFFSTHTHTEHKMRGKNREESCFSFLIIFGEGAILKRAREGGRCELAVSYLLL